MTVLITRFDRAGATIIRTIGIFVTAVRIFRVYLVNAMPFPRMEFAGVGQRAGIHRVAAFTTISAAVLVRDRSIFTLVGITGVDCTLVAVIAMTVIFATALKGNVLAYVVNAKVISTEFSLVQARMVTGIVAVVRICYVLAVSIRAIVNR